MRKIKNLIVGGGLSGLAAARTFLEADQPFLLVESSDQLGGRVRSRQEQGFILDKGFQVLLSSYPENKRWFQSEMAGFYSFDPGAYVYLGGKLSLVVDPLRKPWALFEMGFPKVAKPWDLWVMLKLWSTLGGESLEQARKNSPDMSTADYLKSLGLSKKIIQSFFEPFFGGVFLEDSLSTHASHFRFLFKLFSKGKALLPPKGMGELAQIMAKPLPGDAIMLNTTAQTIESSQVVFNEGLKIEFENLILATDPVHQARFLQLPQKVKMKSTCCYYFKTHEKPYDGPRLVLAPGSDFLIQSCTCLTNVNPHYSSEEEYLVSVTPKNYEGQSEEVEKKLKSDLLRLFPQTTHWSVVAVEDVKHALPEQTEFVQPLPSPHPQIALTGDLMGVASIQTALESGRQAALKFVAS